jgi:glycosyltransferase involved in cell wall biosynthesis
VSISRKVLLVFPQAARIGHGAFYAQRILQTFATVPGWEAVLLTGCGFKDRVHGMPLYGTIFEAPVQYDAIAQHRGGLGALAWGARRYVLQRRLLSYVGPLIVEHGIDVVVFMGGDIPSIYQCWQKNRQAYPAVAWVAEHSMIDFKFSNLSVRSLYKGLVRSQVKEMVEGMGATLLFLNESTRDAFCQLLGLKDEVKARLVFSHYGADSEDMRLPQVEARAALGIPIDAQVALFFGLVRKDKRPDIAIQAVAQARDHWHLLMAGMPYSYTEDEIRSMVSEAGLGDRSLLILRYLGEDEVRLVFSAANVLLSTHDQALVGSSGPLAMCRSYRLPAVVSNLPHFVTAANENGVVFTAQAGDPGSFAERLRQYDSLTPAEKLEMENKLQEAAERLSFATMVQDIISALDLAVANTAAPAR